MVEVIKEILADVLELSKEQIDETITMENVDTWDSLRHMEIMLAIEGKFGIQFEPDELVDMTSYSDIKKLVADKSQ